MTIRNIVLSICECYNIDCYVKNLYDTCLMTGSIGKACTSKQSDTSIYWMHRFVCIMSRSHSLNQILSDFTDLQIGQGRYIFLPCHKIVLSIMVSCWTSVCLSVVGPSIHPFFICRWWVNTNGSGLGLLMCKFWQTFTELSTRNTIMMGYYSLMFLYTVH